MTSEPTVTADLFVTSHPTAEAAAEAARAGVGAVLERRGYAPIGDVVVDEPQLLASWGGREYWAATARQDGAVR